MLLTNLLIDAVDKKQVIAFEYDGKPRLIEPHAFGANTKGELVLRAYQITGDSATNPTAWKLFKIDKMGEVTVTAIASAAPRAGFKKGDTAMKLIYAELDEPKLEAAA